MKAYLAQKDCIHALTAPRPEIEVSRYTRLFVNGRETEAARDYKNEIKAKIRKWKVKDRKAYGLVVQACEDNPTAMEVILDEALANATAKGILEHLEQRFNQGDMVGVIQGKLSAFHSMEIAPNETAENFVNRLLEARRELNDLGEVYVDKDKHCLGRLKESLVRDTRFQQLAFSLRSATTHRPLHA